MQVKFVLGLILVIIISFLIRNYLLDFEKVDKNLQSRIIEIQIPRSFNQNKIVKLLFVGDVMLDRNVENKILENNKNFIYPFINIYDYLNSFDFVVANLEGPVSSGGTKVGSIYSFRMNPSIIESLKKTNIKVLNLANNHIFDYGKIALEDTLNLLKENDLYYYGIGDENSAYEPLILEKDGIKIGFLGFSDFLKHLKPEENKIGIAIIDEKIADYIKKAKEKVDILIVTFHWGEEYQKVHNQRQEEIAKKVISAGANLVIGHHPHVIQDIGVFNDKFIFYSLGNFIFDQDFSKETMEGGLVEIEIDVLTKKIKNVYFRKSYLNENFQVEMLSEPLLIYNLNGKVLLLKIADELKEWEQGLMFVKNAINFDGMVFLFPDKQIRYFWNKNTFVDLEVYWLDDDKIIGRDFLPSIEKTKEIKTIQSPVPVNKVIEVIIKN